MITVSKVIVLLIISWISIYSVSYSLWTWKNNNKLGGSAILVLVAILLSLSVYIAILRG